MLQTPCSTDLKTAVANTLLHWSQDCCCKYLAQLILRLMLQTPCKTDPKVTTTNTLYNWSQTYSEFLGWSWEVVLKPVLWTKLTTYFSKCLMLLKNFSKAVPFIWCLPINYSWDLFSNTILKTPLYNWSENNVWEGENNWFLAVLEQDWSDNFSVSSTMYVKVILNTWPTDPSQSGCLYTLEQLIPANLLVLSNWSQPICLFTHTWATYRWLFLQHL